jgi:hypothetical protein
VITEELLVCDSNVFDAAVPFGGWKDSGIGVEKGEYALLNYTKVDKNLLNIILLRIAYLQMNGLKQAMLPEAKLSTT